MIGLTSYRIFERTAAGRVTLLHTSAVKPLDSRAWMLPSYTGIWELFGKSFRPQELAIYRASKNPIAHGLSLP